MKARGCQAGERQLGQPQRIPKAKLMPMLNVANGVATPPIAMQNSRFFYASRESACTGRIMPCLSRLVRCRLYPLREIAVFSAAMVEQSARSHSGRTGFHALPIAGPALKSECPKSSEHDHLSKRDTTCPTKPRHACDAAVRPGTHRESTLPLRRWPGRGRRWLAPVGWAAGLFVS